MVIDGSLVTPDVRVRKLQNTLHAKAKAEPSYRFYTLWDKIYREDILEIAYRQCRRNKGSHGVDQEQFFDIEAQGIKSWLEKLKEELKDGRHKPKPLRRVWIPKAKGKAMRPLSIPTVAGSIH